MPDCVRQAGQAKAWRLGNAGGHYEVSREGTEGWQCWAGGQVNAGRAGLGSDDRAKQARKSKVGRAGQNKAGRLGQDRARQENKGMAGQGKAEQGKKPR
jgi:hypothetical protein